MKHEPFSYTTIQDLMADCEEKNTPLPISEDLSVLASELRTDNIRLKNRLLAQPIEGFDSLEDGSPSERSVRRYCNLSKYGYGCLWMESVSVSGDGRSNPHQLWIREENCSSFSAMLQEIRSASGDEPPFFVAQLTHSGRNSKPIPVCGFENPLIPVENAVTASDSYLEELEDQYVSAALLAEAAGFDAVDIRACHGYLLGEMLAAYDRPGPYGGCFENRIRLLVNIIKKIRSASGIRVCVRLNMYDGLPYPYGWGAEPDGSTIPCLREPLALLDILVSLGVKVLNISSGIGAVTPYVLRPYDRGGIQPPEHPLEGVYRMLDMAHTVKREHPDTIVIASALSWLREYGPMVAAGGIRDGWFDVAGFGRQSIAYPEFPQLVLSGRLPEREKCCTTCCGCSTLIKKTGKELYCIRHS